MILVVEDNTERINWFENILFSDRLCIATTEKSALKRLRSLMPISAIFLDHDLGENNGTGFGIAERMYAERLQLNAQVFIHSVNPVGAENMKVILDKTHEVMVIPFPELQRRLGPQ